MCASIYVPFEVLCLDLPLLEVVEELSALALHLLGFVCLGRRHEHIVRVLELLRVAHLTQIAAHGQPYGQTHEKSVYHYLFSNF